MSFRKQSNGKWLLDFYPEGKPPAIEFACESMGNPGVHECNATMFSLYRKKRLSGEIASTARVKKVFLRTMNLEQAYFRAVFSELKRLGHRKTENPLAGLRAFKSEEAELAYLDQDEISNLLEQCKARINNSTYCVAALCHATDVRWDEAESLTTKQVKNLKFRSFKTEGNRNRTAPISHTFYDSQSKPKKPGRLFSACYSALRKAVERTELEVPDGQLSHVLRHTFASHCMMNGENILVLKNILGHTGIKMTIRYEHFAPDHLEEAVRLNSLENRKNEK
jgi:site-specific recombinase XerD